MPFIAPAPSSVEKHVEKPCVGPSCQSPGGKGVPRMGGEREAESGRVLVLCHLCCPLGLGEDQGQAAQVSPLFSGCFQPEPVDCG